MFHKKGASLFKLIDASIAVKSLLEKFIFIEKKDEAFYCWLSHTIYPKAGYLCYRIWTKHIFCVYYFLQNMVGYKHNPPEQLNGRLTQRESATLTW